MDSESLLDFSAPKFPSFLSERDGEQELPIWETGAKRASVKSLLLGTPKWDIFSRHVQLAVHRPQTLQDSYDDSSTHL